jgi:hypothetical protein
VVGEGANCVTVVVVVDPQPPMTRAETVNRTSITNKERAFMTCPPIETQTIFMTIVDSYSK